MTWLKPPEILYTQEQLNGRLIEKRQQLEDRTTGRSQQDVSSAVVWLRRILGSHEQRDLMVTLAWFIEDDGTISHHVFKSLEEMALSPDHSSELPRVLLLTSSGLMIGKKYPKDTATPKDAAVATYQPGFIWSYEEVPEANHEKVVRDYQLMPAQLQYVRKLLRMDHRGRTEIIPAHCGCGGAIKRGTGCDRYGYTPDPGSKQELKRVNWHSGRVAPETAARGIHLLANGCTPDEVREVLLGS